MIVLGALTGHCCLVSATLSRTGSYLNVYWLSTKYLSSLWPSRAPPLDLGTPSTLSLMMLGSQDGSSEGEVLTGFGALAGHFFQVPASPSRVELLLHIFLAFYKIPQPIMGRSTASLGPRNFQYAASDFSGGRGPGIDLTRTQ